ncbi:MAG: ribonuclease J [Rickettsiaceae bacterium H1]|nr:ribonuclease J [Rickettsiaceae bacterium H1]
MNKEDFLYLPLGGVGHIGMNVSLYHYKGYWLMIDCGAGFADDYMPGIDIIIPNINFVCEKCENFLGIVLTHAHEDHCGAIQYVWKKLQCPVYASPFTAVVLKDRFKEFNIPESYINRIELNQKFELDPFYLEFISLTHSVPEMNAVSITTDKGRILHSGDWKLDPNPVVGETSNESRLKELGKEGVLALICDSTNVFSEGHSGSEGDLYNSLYELISPKKGAVAITLFASNVARIETISKIAKECGREVAVFGRSLMRIINAAKESGYLQEVEFISPEEASQKPRDKIMLLCTGCQGDVMSAANRLANNTHRLFELQKGDTIIFSSKIIPGNEKRIFGMLNKFTKMGVEIITEKDHAVHVSGHPYRDELKKMYELVKPKIAIPVHGEHMHIAEHVKLAKECNIPEALTIADGDIIKLNEESTEKIAKIKTSFLGIDGTLFQSSEGDAMKERRNMRDNGMIIVILVINSNNELLKLPTVMAPGLLENKKLLSKLSKEIEKELFSADLSDYRVISKLVRTLIRNSLKRTKKRPYVEVQIERIRR